jgi:hypothetical protein
VTEVPGRLDYLHALSVLTQASAILLLGSSEAHYTASKLFPALLARRPILALFHEASSVVSMLQLIGAQHSVRIVPYGDRLTSDDGCGEVAGHLRALAARSSYDAADLALERADEFSARSLARRLAALFDRVAAA